MKRLFISILAVMFVFCMAGLVFAQGGTMDGTTGGGGMTNAPGGTMTLPNMTDDTSDTFMAASASEARAICDQLGAVNNKTCKAVKGTSSATGGQNWYCKCK